ncbi:hypothetical protein [Pararhizobium sp. IMCC21322]|nr:hypothetical protein [Pararhizobium sp. IMCC21322]
MRAFLCAIVAIAGIAVLFDYGLPRVDIPGVDSSDNNSVRLDD